MSALFGRTIAVAVTGSIAAYKAVEVVRLCIKAGSRVLPVMTASASKFIGPLTLSGIAGESVALDMFDPAFPGEVHVEIAARADAVAIVPATADVLARLAAGRADDLVTALALSARTPVLVAPAMHPRMWAHPATQRNVKELLGLGRVTLVGPVEGPVASGETGMGRMAEPEAIVRALEAALTPRDLDGVRVLVTAGPTVEDVDPVRFLGNRSSGKMGFAVAERAAVRGADVTLVAGPAALATPPGVRRVDVRSAAQMLAAVEKALGKDQQGADALVMAAAVADYRPAKTSVTKTKKQGEHLTLDLVKTPDILAGVGRDRQGGRPVLVGFAVETGDVVAYARAKLVAKKVDLVVANDAEKAFGGDENLATLVTGDREETLPVMTKLALADVILDRVLERLG